MDVAAHKLYSAAEYMFCGSAAESKIVPLYELMRHTTPLARGYSPFPYQI